eukprot:gnl/TRDRNA2_/TRDRNA2_181900_c0_seq1.p1 gnl/TRDRNA2_/TRDRNA2_181900_c0~~gnl/TRDRNA2_/TRDRNA2_181900_c0_seq1.p1  ORF type:complete len:131 (+),score=28.60 gnl/TRDRNA2_/TRDRNA2_181900_c0_seq1:104-496(+)
MLHIVPVLLVWVLLPLLATARLVLLNQSSTAQQDVIESQRKWFKQVAAGKHCEGGVELAVKKKTPHGCFAKAWSCRYFGTVGDSYSEEFKCFALPDDTALDDCGDGPMKIYEVRRGEKPIESNKTASFHP